MACVYSRHWRQWMNANKTQVIASDVKSLTSNPTEEEEVKQEWSNRYLFVIKWPPLDGRCPKPAGFRCTSVLSLASTAHSIYDKVQGTIYIKRPQRWLHAIYQNQFWWGLMRFFWIFGLEGIQEGAKGYKICASFRVSIFSYTFSGVILVKKTVKNSL